MKKVFISKNYKDRFIASSKAKCDCENIALKYGYKNIGLKPTNIQNPFLGRIWTLLSNLIAFVRMPFSSIVFLQYPVNLFNWQMKFAKWKKNRVVVILHDIDFLRGNKEFNYKKEIELSDVLIVHTKRMHEWCLKHLTCSKILILEAFDYLCENRVAINYFDDSKITIAFAGNIGKSRFLNDLQTLHPNIQFNIFGVGGEKLKLSDNVSYKGCFSPNDLGDNLKSMFGLVWDGESIDTCNGITGDYLKYISPHKLSMYISAGVPVIVWKKSAMAEFVEKRNIGIALESLQELNFLIGRLDRQQYDEIFKNVQVVRSQVMNGSFLSKILKEIENNG